MDLFSLPVVIIRFLIGKCLGSKRNLKSYFTDGWKVKNRFIGVVAVIIIAFIVNIVKSKQ